MQTRVNPRETRLDRSGVRREFRPSLKSNFAFVFLCLVLLTPLGCNSKTKNKNLDANASTQTDEDSSSKKFKIALVMKSLTNEFFSTMADGAKAHQAEHSDQYELNVVGLKDERDVNRQAELVAEMAASDVDAIVIAPADSNALIAPLRRAIKDGVVVVNIDNRLDAEQLSNEELVIPFVGPDNEAGAKTVAMHLASKLKKGDAVAILEGLQTSENGRARKAGFEAAMADAGMKIVDSQSAEWEMSKANEVASSMLSEHTEIKAILAANDNMAMGAIAAVKSVGRSGEVQIVGFDNIEAIQDAIRSGKVLATADQHADQLAAFGIEAALQILNDPSAKIQDKETPVDLVTADNL